MSSAKKAEAPDSKLRNMEHNMPQPQDRSMESHQRHRPSKGTAFSANQQLPLSSNRITNVVLAENSEERSGKNESARKLVAEVLVRYWSLKGEQQTIREQDSAGVTPTPGNEVGANHLSRKHDNRRASETGLENRHDRHPLLSSQSLVDDFKLSVPPAFGDSNVDGFSHTRSQSPKDQEYKMLAQSTFAYTHNDDKSTSSGSADRGYKSSGISRFTDGEHTGDLHSSHPRINSCRNQEPHPLSRFVAASPASERKRMGKSDKAIIPVDSDVLFGRRQAQRKHPGNIRLRELCHQFQGDYRSGDRGNKTAITWRIVHMIHEEGGRFLKFDMHEESWTEVNNDTAREKVAFTIRDILLHLPPRDA